MLLSKNNKPLKIALVVPHVFMHEDILPHVIFSPGKLALDLANALHDLGCDITLFSPGPVQTRAKNITANLAYFEHELAGRGDTYMDLLKKHPVTFITLARQVQSQLIAKAYAMANAGDFDAVHIYTNEEEIAMPFAELCQKPVVFTHHDPFNFLVKYKNNFPMYRRLNWLSMSWAQRKGMPTDTNWIGNIYHGLPADALTPNYQPIGDYVAYLGRIIEPKGVHLAIAAAKKAGVRLKIAGKHYAGHKKDTYWQQQVLPHIDNDRVQYVGFLANNAARQDFLGNARALLAPSTFDEPFGMVMIESLACATPVIGLNSGAIPEVILHGKTGFVVDRANAADGLADAMMRIGTISRQDCRRDFESRFTLQRMAQEHLATYQSLTK